MMLKKILKKSAYFLFVISAVFLLLEVCFRFQVIDFYSTEWKLLNKNADKGKASKKILVFGDSYSATTDGYIQMLRDSFPEYQFYNASIPGTGIRQTALIAAKRINEVKPDLIIYQVYVGNDLTDIKHPINWSNLPFSRNCYWKISDHLLFIHYLNYWSGQFASHSEVIPGKVDSIFSIDKYNPREKLFVKSDPYVFENAITLNGTDSLLFKQLIEDTKSTFSEYIKSGKIYFLIIPHEIQVNKTYYENMKMLGCSFKYSYEDLNGHYSFRDKFIREFGDKVLDPLPYLQQNDSAANLFFANDPHLTPKGQKALSSFLIKTCFSNLK